MRSRLYPRWIYCQRVQLVSRLRSSLSTEGGEAPGWQGAMSEHIGNIRTMSNAARRDASPAECQRTSETRHYHDAKLMQLFLIGGDTAFAADRKHSYNPAPCDSIGSRSDSSIASASRRGKAIRCRHVCVSWSKGPRPFPRERPWTSAAEPAIRPSIWR